MSDIVNANSPVMDRAFLEDVVSIKLSEVETLLQEREKDLQEQLNTQTTVYTDAHKVLEEYCRDDAEAEVGEKLRSIVAAFNASELFPKMEYAVGSGYGSADFAKQDDYGVGVEIAVAQDKNITRIASGGLPVTTSSRAKTMGGLKVIAATTAIVKISPRVKAQDKIIKELKKSREALEAELSKVREYLRNMSSAERKVRAAVARNHLEKSDQGKQAIDFLQTLGLSSALGKGIEKLLPGA